MTSDDLIGNQTFPKSLVHQYLRDKCLFLLRRRKVFRLYGEGQCKRDALTLVVLDLDLATVMIDDEIACHQVDAKFLGIVIAKEKRVEDGKKGFIGQSRTIISNLPPEFLYEESR
jgi:hypothetical protein